MARAVMVFAFLITTSMVCGEYTSIDINELRWEEKQFYVPNVNELVDAFSSKLTENYEEVSVKIRYTPVLTDAPYNLAGSGLSGSPTIIDVGGEAYLFPTPNFTKNYDLVDIARKVLPNAETTVMSGAGAGPFAQINQCTEGIFSMNIQNNGTFVSDSYIAYVKPSDKSYQLESIPSSQTKSSFMTNLYVSQGRRGKVIQIKAKKRIGEQASFIEMCRKVLVETFVNKTVGMGGVFFMKSGTAFIHVMQNYTTPVNTQEDSNKFFKYVEMTGPMVGVGTFVSSDMGINLRQFHFHIVTQNNLGGHYEYDTTPDSVEYEAYFNVAERVVRIDRPDVPWQFKNCTLIPTKNSSELV